ncbi:hypothetical protein BCR34DRAFT_621944 [Clohesyomyces aquaticus]|uniref:NADH:flavin oxidoreductase/NADH oxidase N-terminal domain-containing protein n=1 Tax=Clohesyomyces aquaticus TaxID=1231657 RepID=A0A1Y2A4F9_9PLEO|nr:hypothetical protein BCR34DRAFT_621944 [Clohesyomyces aquaticus]
MAQYTSARKSDIRNEPSSSGQFQFVSVRGPDDVKDQNAKRIARSHAVARGLQKKRDLQQKSGLNFRAVSCRANRAELASKRIASHALGPSQLFLSFEAPDAFQTLAAEAPRLQVLLNQLKTQNAAQPVFSILDELVLKSLHSVLRRGLDDHAFLSAFMLTCTFAVTSSSIDKRYLCYQSEALSAIRQRMNRSDLNASVLTGSDRIVDHTTFSELQWRRDPFSSNFFVLPPGFQPHSHLLGGEFVEILKDISALQCIRDSYFLGTEDVISMAHIDNHQASIQSRLVSLPHLSTFAECCHLAAYLCSAMLRCRIWRTSTVPSHLSFQLLCKLQESNNDVIWEGRTDILAWMLYIGGAFAPTGPIRSDYASLLHLNQSTRIRWLYTSWPELLAILKQFIWSEKAFQSQVKGFWEDFERDYHRIGMAPLTRLRATDDRVPTPLMKEYYGQRAAVPGTLIISEGAIISASDCAGFPNAPGIWREDQVTAWRAITDEVHSKGCPIFCQLFRFGRAADAESAAEQGLPFLAPSAIPIENGGPVPRAMSVGEIEDTILDFVQSSQNAIRAGFDGVEINCCNGYLLDQFLQDVSNTRTDAYGGSVENRSRFLNNLIKAVANAIGPQRVGLRLSPWGTFQGMRMTDPIPQFTDVILKTRRSNIAYLHLVESRISGAEDSDGHETLDFAYDLWEGPLLIAGGYKTEEARELVDKRYPDKDIMVIFGRRFLANPDLVFRIQQGLELNAHDRSTFYVMGSPVGYVDYPFSNEYLTGRGVGEVVSR